MGASQVGSLATAEPPRPPRLPTSPTPTNLLDDVLVAHLPLPLTRNIINYPIGMAGLLKKPLKLALVQLASGKW